MNKGLVKNFLEKRFFKRFSVTLIEKLFDHGLFGQARAKTLVFVEKHETIIVLKGSVVVYNHI
jgi:hypothetical protein